MNTLSRRSEDDLRSDLCNSPFCPYCSTHNGSLRPDYPEFYFDLASHDNPLPGAYYQKERTPWYLALLRRIRSLCAR